MYHHSWKAVVLALAVMLLGAVGPVAAQKKPPSPFITSGYPWVYCTNAYKTNCYVVDPMSGRANCCCHYQGYITRPTMSYSLTYAQLYVGDWNTYYSPNAAYTASYDQADQQWLYSATTDHAAFSSLTTYTGWVSANGKMPNGATWASASETFTF